MFSSSQIQKRSFKKTLLLIRSTYSPEQVPLGNFTIDVTIPKNTPAGDSVLTAAVPFLVGASGLTKVHAFNATIAVTAA